MKKLFKKEKEEEEDFINSPEYLDAIAKLDGRIEKINERLKETPYKEEPKAKEEPQAETREIHNISEWDLEMLNRRIEANALLMEILKATKETRDLIKNSLEE